MKPYKIPEAHIKAYLEENGIHCPRCGSKQTEGYYDSDEFGPFNKRSCLVCRMTWVDRFTLTAIVGAMVPEPSDWEGD